MSKAKGVGFDTGSLTVGIGGRFFTVQAADPQHQSNLRKLRKGVRPASEGVPFSQHSFAMITSVRLKDASVRFT